MTIQMLHKELLEPPRVVVDPNRFSRTDPTVSLALFADADRMPAVGEVVLATQPDDDGSVAGAYGRVVEINEEYELISVRVDWSQFSRLPEHDATHLQTDLETDAEVIQFVSTNAQSNSNTGVHQPSTISWDTVQIAVGA